MSAKLPPQDSWSHLLRARLAVLQIFFCLLGAACLPPGMAAFASDERPAQRIQPLADGLLATEKLAGEGIWLDPAFKTRFRQVSRTRATVWFDDQLLGDGKAYLRRAKEFAGRKRVELREAAMKTLRAIHARSWKQAKPRIDELVDEGKISQVETHWIVNGFSCITVQEHIESLRSIPGVKKIFAGPRRPVHRPPPRRRRSAAAAF